MVTSTMGDKDGTQPKRRSRLWVVIGYLVALALVIGACGALWWQQRQHHRETQMLVLSIDNQLLASNGAPRLVSSRDVEHNCLADRNNLKCTFTNTNAFRVATCVTGRLQASDGGMSSMRLCSGAIEPYETRTASAPWLGGFADDVCYKETRFGAQLDWSKCSFKTSDALPPRE